MQKITQTMSLEKFRQLPTEQVARLVRETGQKVCVFPLNGTRRWFMLEHPDLAAMDSGKVFLQISGQRFIEICTMFFDHGIDTVLTPTFGPELIGRGEKYMQLVLTGIAWFVQKAFLTFYDDYQVRVRVYGDARRYLQDAVYTHALDAFEEIAQRTADHRRHRLFFGICAHDATETVAEIAVRFYQEHGHLPNRRQIVEAYYGEYVEPVDLFIGFADRPAVFDMPLVAVGNEDLYFTVAPSPYLDVHNLRAILYDHLYARQVDEASYAELSPEDWQTLADFYTLNRQHVMGLGHHHKSGHFWYPLPQVELPPGMVDISEGTMS